MPRPNKEKIISDLVLELEKGSDKKYLLAKNGKEWQIPTRTFERYWKEANKRFSESSKSVQEKIQEAKEETAVNEFESIYLDKAKHVQELYADIERLREITAGKSVSVKGQIISATFSDELRAKSEIRAIRKQIGDWYGFNAPKKLDHTTGGESINPMSNIQVVIKEK